MDPPVLISDSSDDDISLSGEHTNDWVEASQSYFSFSLNTLSDDPSVMQHHQEIDIASNGLHQMSPHSNDLELTSSSSETTNDAFEVNDIELSGNPRERYLFFQLAIGIMTPTSYKCFPTF
jgi:hypothetical protein